MDELPNSPFNEFLGIEMLHYENGEAECRVQLKDHHLNTGGRVHGGVLTSLADSAAGVAVRSIRPDGKLSATTDLNIAFVRPPKGDSLHAFAKVIHSGKQLYRVEIDIHSDEKLVAKSNATFMIVEPYRKS